MLVYAYYTDQPLALLEFKEGLWSVLKNRYDNKYSQDWRINDFYHENLTSGFIEEVLEDRRIDLARVNRAGHLPESVFGLIPELKVTHGMDWGDAFWVSFDEFIPEQFWKLHPRAEDYR